MQYKVTHSFIDNCIQINSSLRNELIQLRLSVACTAYLSTNEFTNLADIYPTTLLAFVAILLDLLKLIRRGPLFSYKLKERSIDESYPQETQTIQTDPVSVKIT